MIIVRKSPEPQSLISARQLLQTQIDTARLGGLQIELLKKSAKLKKPPGVLEIRLDDALYKPPEAKARLILDHLGKCAYCESRFMGTAGGDVEHFRPKKGFNEFDGSTSTGLGPRTKLGYFFLAYSWDNHLWACKACNETYKKNYFGVMPDMAAPPDPDEFASDQDFRAALEEWATTMTKRSDWTTGSIDTEQSILIDPSKENPREHIHFDPETGYAVGGQLDDKGKLIAPSHRGGATIRYLGLNRAELVFARAQHLTLLRAVFVEMTRHQELVLEFLKWQRGDNWADEARASRLVSREGRSTAPIDRSYEEHLGRRGVKLRPWAPNYPNVQLGPDDDAVPSDRRQPDSGPCFSKKASVRIPDERAIRDDPKLSPFDFLVYSVTPRAAFSALAADALAAWSLELAEHLVRPIEFVSQLNRPRTDAPEPNRATVDLSALHTHATIMNFYARDQEVLRALTEDLRIERAAFDAGTDARGLCFVCRKVLETLITEHRALQRHLPRRHTPQYDRDWEKHARELDELEKTFRLYGCDKDDWAGAVRTMNENLDKYPPDRCHDLTPSLNRFIQQHNELVHQVATPAAQTWDQAVVALEQNATRLVRDLEGRNAQDESEYSVAQELERSLQRLRASCFFTDKLNELIRFQQWLMNHVGSRHDPVYANGHGNATQFADGLERRYQASGFEIDDFSERLGEVKSELQAFPPDPRFVPGSPQARPKLIAPLGPPDVPEIMAVDYDPPAPWVQPQAPKVRSNTQYPGRGSEARIYAQVRYSVVKG